MSLGAHTFSFPIWVEFGNGKSDRVGELIDSKGWKTALIITDQGIRKAGILDIIETSIEGENITYDIYDNVKPNPTESMVSDALSVLESGDHDVVVAVGGGSVIDTAKCATLLKTNHLPLSEYEVNTPADVTAGTIESQTHPLITIPTTAGTGSEVDYWAVITAEERQFKMAIGQPPLSPGGPYLGADISLVDPELTASLPPRQTAATGFDAFSHALENHVAAGAPELVKPYTHHVMGLVSTYLSDAYATGNMQSREQLLFGSHMAGFCENYAGFGAIHSLAEVTGGMYPEIPHGEAIAVFTPPVMRYNLETHPARYAEVAEAVGVTTSGLSDLEAARRGVEAVETLIDSVDLPTSLEELGVDSGDLERIASKSLETIEIHDNPREADAADLLEITRNAY
jgi:alcohol dehydrogenase class IV